MKLPCIAIDDEPPALKLVESYITQTSFLSLEGAFTNPIQGLEMAEQNQIPLVFVDINMPDLNGMQFSRLLPENTKVIFTTAYEEYALESYRVAALDYLLKPFNYEEFLQAAHKARDWFNLVQGQSQSQDFLFVKADYKIHKINHRDILFIENMKEYVRFHLANNTRLMSLMSLKSLDATLPDNFMQVHRSYIVNLDAITTIERSHIVFGRHLVPVSERYRETFQAFLKGKSIP